MLLEQVFFQLLYFLLNKIEILNKKVENLEDTNNFNFKNYSILSMIKEYNNQNSSKTLISSSYIKLKDYEINKYDELNKSLSNISNFDLEKEEENDSNNLSFNSLDYYDDEFDVLDIIIQKNKNKNNNEKNKEYELELDKEFEEIKNEILNEKSKSK